MGIADMSLTSASFLLPLKYETTGYFGPQNRAMDSSLGTGAWDLVQSTDGAAQATKLRDGGGCSGSRSNSEKSMNKFPVADLKSEEKLVIVGRLDHLKAFYCMPLRGAVARGLPISVPRWCQLSRMQKQRFGLTLSQRRNAERFYSFSKPRSSFASMLGLVEVFARSSYSLTVGWGFDCGQNRQ